MDPRRLMVPARHELHEALRPLRKQLRHVVEALGLPFDDSLFTSPHLQAYSSEDVDPIKVFNTLLRKVADRIVQRSRPVVSQQPSLRQKPVKFRAEASIPLPASKETSMHRMPHTLSGILHSALPIELPPLTRPGELNY